MPTALLEKVAPDAYTPLGVESQEAMKRVKVGGVVEIKFVNKRNYEFHKKFFKLLELGFSMWEPPEPDICDPDLAAMVAQYGPPTKNAEDYRHKMIILAGYYETVYELGGGVRLIAKSISFASMEEEEFSELYSKMIDVILMYTPDRYGPEDIRSAAAQIVGFA